MDKLLAASGGHTPYSDEQIELIKEEIKCKGDKQLLLFIQFIYFTLVRPGELGEPKVGNILDKTILVPIDKIAA